MVGSSEEKKESAHNDNREVTVDDLLPAIQEIYQRLDQIDLEIVRLKDHEHGVDGKPVVRL